MSCQWKMACMAGRGLIFLIQLWLSSGICFGITRPDSGLSHAPQPLTCCERCPSLWLPPCSQSCVFHLVDPFLPNTMTFPLPRFPFLPFHPPPSLLHRTVLCYFIASQGFPADFCWKCKSKEKRGKKEKEKKVKKKRHAAISTPPPLRVPAVYSEVCGWVAGKRDVRSNKEKKHLPFYASMARFMRWSNLHWSSECLTSQKKYPNSTCVRWCNPTCQNTSVPYNFSKEGFDSQKPVWTKFF